MARILTAVSSTNVLATVKQHSVLDGLKQFQRSTEDIPFRFAFPYRQLSVFVRRVDIGAALRNVPLYGLLTLAPADLDKVFPASSLQDHEKNIVAGDVAKRAKARKGIVIPLGVLISDHAGYASFDLAGVRSQGVFDRAQTYLDEIGTGAQKQLADGRGAVEFVATALTLLPFGDPWLAYDVLARGDIAPDYIVARVDIDAGMLEGRNTDFAGTSLQTPSILDWRLSPSSFSLSGTLLIGEDGCETMLPGNLSSRLYRFRRSVRITPAKGKPYVPLSGRKEHGEVRPGIAVELATEWFPIGHSLGQIAYSLPLAPGEKIQLAVIDWSRSDRTSRDEDTKVSEALVHDQTQDRTVSETVEMVVKEKQKGSAVMAGTAGSGAGGGSGQGSTGIFSFGGAGAASGIFSLGGSGSKSEGTRSVQGETVQELSDSFHQASSAVRELRSTVVIQSNEAESATARTRIVANYNHSHALTLLYYEVLSHNRLVTRSTARRTVLYVQRAPLDFSDLDVISRHRPVLERYLLDRRFATGLAEVERYRALDRKIERQKERDEEFGRPSDFFEVGDITIIFRSGTGAPKDFVKPRLVLASGEEIGVTVADPRVGTGLAGGVTGLLSTDAFRTDRDPKLEPGKEFSASFKPARRILWKDLYQVRLVNSDAPIVGPSSDAPWDVAFLHLATWRNNINWVLFEGTPPDSPVPVGGSTTVAATELNAPPRSADDLMTDAQLDAMEAALEHLEENTGYYSSAVWLGETQEQRYRNMRELGISGRPLFDVVENTLYDVDNGQLIMPVNEGQEDFVNGLFNIEEGVPEFAEYVEQLVTLPTRGIFGEAKLGHCNASEIIDSSRFWDWQSSPIPDAGPQINPLSTESRTNGAEEGVTPTPMPPSLINIVNPSAQPAPTGLSVAGNLLGSLGAFRDMSGMAQLGSFLENLANNTTSMTNKALEAVTSGRATMDSIRNSPELSAGEKATKIGQVQDAMIAAQGQPKPEATPTPNPGPKDPDPVKPPDVPTGVPPSTPKPVPVPKPQPEKSDTNPTGRARIVFTFSHFNAFDGINSVWGRVTQDPKADGTPSISEGIPNGAPDSGQRSLVFEKIDDDGSFEITVQVRKDYADPTDSARYKLDANRVAHIGVQPQILEKEVEDSTKQGAIAKLLSEFKGKFGDIDPMDIVILGVTTLAGVVLKIDDPFEEGHVYRFKIRMIGPDLVFSGDVGTAP